MDGFVTDESLAATIDLLNRPRSLDELVVALVSTEAGFTSGEYQQQIRFFFFYDRQYVFLIFSRIATYMDH